MESQEIRTEAAKTTVPSRAGRFGSPEHQIVSAARLDSVWTLNPRPLTNLPPIRVRKALKVSEDNGVVRFSVRVWGLIRKREKRADFISVITPTQKTLTVLQVWIILGFSPWEDGGIEVLRDLFEGDKMMTFDQLRQKHGLHQHTAVGL